jgi:predicted MFS family arabinose efflux permease
VRFSGWGVTWSLDGQSFGIVMMVFGAIGVVFTMLDARAFRRDGPGEWMVSHLQRMIAAFISTVSAVSAVNLTPVIGIWAWLWPTVLGVPLIVYWSNTYSTE